MKNGNFSSGDTHWTLGDYHDVAEGSVVNREYRISISSPQQEEWAVQLMQNDINLTENSTYELIFDAYADVDKTIVTAVGPGISGDISVDITTVKKNYKVSFSTVKKDAIASRLDFNVGKTSGYVALDNIVIKEFKPAPDTLNLPVKDCRFPTRSIYPFGIKPSCFTQAQMNGHCIAWFRKWKQKYVTSQGCEPGECRVQRIETGDDNTYDSVSEGIAYGMIITVYMHNDANDTRYYFDGLWKYYSRYKNDNGLMNWRVYSNGTMHYPGGSATDADIDAAFALFMAYRQWGNDGSVKYFDEATELTASILRHEITADNDLRPGDSWDIGNPSYFAPAYFTLFSRLTGLTRWNSVASRTYNTIVGHYHTSDETYDSTLGIYTGLQPNWCKYEGGEQGPGEWAMDHNSFWWDACRFPWRQGYDYLLHGEKNSEHAKINTSRVSRYFKAKYDADPTKIKSHYKLDGEETAWTGTPNPHLGTEDTMNLAGFIGSIAIAAMVDEDQEWLDTMYRRLVELPLCETGVNWGTDYFCDILKMIYLLVISGNMPDLYTDFAIDSTNIHYNTNASNKNDIILRVLPSRYNRRITISLALPKKMDVVLNLCDVRGRIVKRWCATVKGKRQYTLDSSLLTSGIYFVRLKAGNKMYNRKLLQIK
ncbi:glycosyl hydrolase family 8 [Fibrobacterota bacterium]